MLTQKQHLKLKGKLLVFKNKEDSQNQKYKSYKVVEFKTLLLKENQRKDNKYQEGNHLLNYFQLYK